MGEARFFELLLWAMFAVAGATLLFSLFTAAPYGRYRRPWWSGPKANSQRPLR